MQEIMPVPTSRNEAPVTTSTNKSAQAADEIYIGFQKGDYAPRTGRKGRVIRDDPSKYPAKEDVGFLPGATGGWAGGEAALWQLREAVLAEKQATQTATTKQATATQRASVPKPSAGTDAIYLGFGKDEIEARKAGAKGRVIVDDPRKYPAKENLGPLTGATGGFAGGERGLKQFIESGELRMRQPGDPVRRQSSPVAIAGLLIAAGAGGGLFLNSVTDLGETVIKTDLLEAPIDDKTKYLLLAAVALLGGAGTLAAGRAAVTAVQSRLQGAVSQGAETAQKLVILAGFWVAVFFAARAILEL
eukprot:jgi/Chrzof1/960/Cz01g34360.t1